MKSPKQGFSENHSGESDKVSPKLALNIRRLFGFFIESGIPENKTDEMAVTMESGIVRGDIKPN